MEEDNKEYDDYIDLIDKKLEYVVIPLCYDPIGESLENQVAFMEMHEAREFCRATSYEMTFVIVYLPQNSTFSKEEVEKYQGYWRRIHPVAHLRSKCIEDHIINHRKVGDGVIYLIDPKGKSTLELLELKGFKELISNRNYVWDEIDEFTLKLKVHDNRD